jgi:transposase
MSKVSVVGLDLAKNVFQVHGVDEAGEVALRKQLKRSQVQRFFARLSPCLVGMEACGGAHYWARVLTELGHTARLMAPAFVKPYLKSNKNDRNDAEAICEAVQRPTMRFVAAKTPEQQSVLHLHHGRQLLVRQRVALSNHMRGILLEYGMSLPRGFAAPTGIARGRRKCPAHADASSAVGTQGATRSACGTDQVSRNAAQGLAWR